MDKAKYKLMQQIIGIAMRLRVEDVDLSVIHRGVYRKAISQGMLPETFEPLGGWKDEN